MEFKIGDQVRWHSQAGRGYGKTKVGKIVAVVPNGVPTNETGNKLAEALFGPGNTYRAVKLEYTLHMDWGYARDHESCLVAVQQGTTGKAKPALYWPRVSGLEKA